MYRYCGFLDAVETHGPNASGPRGADRIAKTSARHGSENKLHRKGQLRVGTDRITDRRSDTFGGHRSNIPPARLGDHRFRAVDEPKGTSALLVLRLADRHQYQKEERDHT